MLCFSNPWFVSLWANAVHLIRIEEVWDQCSVKLRPIEIVKNYIRRHPLPKNGAYPPIFDYYKAGIGDDIGNVGKS